MVSGFGHKSLSKCRHGEDVCMQLSAKMSVSLGGNTKLLDLLTTGWDRDKPEVMEITVSALPS